MLFAPGAGDSLDLKWHVRVRCSSAVKHFNFCILVNGKRLIDWGL